MNVADWLTKLANGRYIDGAVSVYTDLMGDIFFGAIGFMVFFSLFLRSNSTILPIITFLFTSGIFLYFLPIDAHGFIYIVLAIEFAIILTRVFTSRGD